MNNKIHVETIGQTEDGHAIKAFTLSNQSGLRATFLNWGGALIELEVPDRIGMPDDIVLGLDSIDDYLTRNDHYMGVLVGRFSSRIKGGSCTLEGKKLQLPVNEEAFGNHLHGGPRGFSHQLMDAEVLDRNDEPALRLSYHSPDGEMGYPGNLAFSVTLALTRRGGLRYEYAATTDAPTFVNFTTHPYFNLAGQDCGNIRQHQLQLLAAHFLPNNPKTNTPTGQLEPVGDSPFDFREPDFFDHRLDSPNTQIEQAKGFDHAFVLNPERNPQDDPVAIVSEPESGRRMEVYTSEPGIQLYTANNLDGSFSGKNGCFYQRHAGFCLETQHFPDSPNLPEFPSTRLNPGQSFQSFTEYRFSST